MAKASKCMGCGKVVVGKDFSKCVCPLNLYLISIGVK